ncbi:putative peptidyl-tRNA hydrolase PTRHD1 isoform X3 [Diachasmimorpha longicaudata]|uniref:putative peptidyl-tRNA hydrolase PTRHD1 isoform X3 n=1 Tax=Diachasmimorpha longicaudata TaxID=58733 RepID=UPI0030B880B0
MSGIVQYVIVRGDLTKTMQWPVGAVIAQACHACTAVTHLFYNDEHTQAYLSDLDNMHKVILEAPDDKSLHELHSKLEESKVDHKLWIEQPENIPTCVVVKPYPKECWRLWVNVLKSVCADVEDRYVAECTSQLSM